MGDHAKKIEKLVEKNNAAKIAGFLSDKHLETVLEAIDGLGKCSGDDAFNPLVPLLRDAEPQVRAAAAKALGVMKEPRGRTFLSLQLEHETDETVKKAICDALDMIKVVN